MKPITVPALLLSLGLLAGCAGQHQASRTENIPFEE